MKRNQQPLVALMILMVLAGSALLSRAAPAEDSAPGAADAYRVYMPTALHLPPPPAPLVNGDFEAGATGWTEFSALGFDLIVQDFPGSITPHSGTWAAWLGGEDNETSTISQQVTVPADAATLSYWHWIASADICWKDRFSLKVNGTRVHTYLLCESSDTNGWQKVSVNLGAYAGQKVNLELSVTTDESLNSNLIIDDVSFGAAQTAAAEEPATAPVADASSADPARATRR